LALSLREERMLKENLVLVNKQLETQKKKREAAKSKLEKAGTSIGSASGKTSKKKTTPAAK
jgi:hypothetical protein